MTCNPLKSIDTIRPKTGRMGSAARAAAILAFFQDTHAAVLAPPTTCTIHHSTWWLLCMTLLAGFAVAVTSLVFKLRAHRASAVRLAGILEGVAGQARIPAVDESGSADIVRLARAINKVRRHQAEREAQHLDVQAGYAHDLRTPLTRMGLRCELLGDSEAREAMERDLAEMRELVEGSIACARMQHSLAEPLQRVDADGLIDNLVRGYRDSGSPIALDGRIGRPVVACPLALRRVLANLIDNALRYGTDVRVCARIEMKSLVLAVVDAGPGIRPGQIDAVLSPWVRGQQSQDGKPGSGLGLAISRRLVQAMQGELHLENRRSGGFEARLTLPLVVA